MPRFIALFRGVNVGKGNRLSMADLTILLEEMGFTEVRTLLNSGNAVFSSARRSAEEHATAIESALESKLGVKAPTIVKTAAEFEAILGEAPMAPPETDHSKFLVVFARDAHAIQALAPLQTAAQSREKFFVTRQAAFLHCPDGVLQSHVGAALLGKAGRGVTTRTWATVLKLAAAVGVRVA